MKNSKLRALLKEVDSEGLDDAQFLDLNFSVYLNYRGGSKEPNGTCGPNGSCSGNGVCIGNTSCSGNVNCANNTSCNY
jgi:hypothetical protein